MNTILISIIAIPIIEILLFIKIGENIGAINTILLIIFTAIVGVYFARIQGIKTIRSGFINIYQNKLPISSDDLIKLLEDRKFKFDLITHKPLYTVNESKTFYGSQCENNELNSLFYYNIHLNHYL